MGLGDVSTKSSSSGTISEMADGRPRSRKKLKDSTWGADNWRRRFTSVGEGRWPLRKEGHVSNSFGFGLGGFDCLVLVVVVVAEDVLEGEGGDFMMPRWWCSRRRR